MKLIIKEKTIKLSNTINDPYDYYDELELDMAESKDIKKNKILKFLFSLKKSLYNYKLWTDENFEKLNLKI